MKFIHAADIHLDSPLKGLSAYEHAPAERLRTATRSALERLVHCAIEEEVDFLVIAGDVYDGDWKDFNTGLFFVRQMGRLRQAGIPVYLLYGNHDAESEMTTSLNLPDNVHVFSSRKAETFRLPAHRVALHGRSFKEAATTSNLLPSYPEPVPGWLNVGVLHTALEGHAEHARYAPCSLAELRAKGYRYWALGHVHERWIDQDSASQVTVAYPGNLQGRHIRETGERGALLVRAEGDEILDVQPLALDVLRCHLLEVDIGSVSTLDECLSLVEAGLVTALAQAPEAMPLAVRVVFVGKSAAHAALVLSEHQLRHEVLAKAVGLDAERLWVEKVRVSSEPLEGPAAGHEAEGALAALADYASEAADDEGFAQAMQTEWQQVLDKMPHEVLQASPELQLLRQNLAEQLPKRLKQALPALMARVGSADSTSS